MSGIPQTSPSKAPKVRYLSVKSGPPEFSGIVKRIKSFSPDSPDQVSFVPIRDVPNTPRWSGS
eukprot:12429106-Karenia_brevis.AAC.1